MREKIITKSEDLFLSLGFKSVTMDDIANAPKLPPESKRVHFYPSVSALRAQPHGLDEQSVNFEY